MKSKGKEEWEEREIKRCLKRGRNLIVKKKRLNIERIGNKY